MQAHNNLQRWPDTDDAQPSKYAPENSESLAETLRQQQPVTSSPGEEPYAGSHDDNYEGKITTGTPYHDEDDVA